LCCHKGDSDIFNLLIENGAYDCISIQDRDGCSPLHLAAIASHWEIVLQLVEKCNNIEILDLQNNEGNSLLFISCEKIMTNSSLKLCELLIEKGVNVTKLNKKAEI
jgi:ankyrin repeat protein